jgi:hypothetical protein
MDLGLFIDSSVSPVSLMCCTTPVHRVACSDVCEQLHHKQTGTWMGQAPQRQHARSVEGQSMVYQVNPMLHRTYMHVATAHRFCRQLHLHTMSSHRLVRQPTFPSLPLGWVLQTMQWLLHIIQTLHKPLYMQSKCCANPVHAASSPVQEAATQKSR